MTGKIDLIVKGSKAQLFINGVDVSDHCVGYSIAHTDGCPRITVKLLCSEINADIEGEVTIRRCLANQTQE